MKKIWKIFLSIFAIFLFVGIVFAQTDFNSSISYPRYWTRTDAGVLTTVDDVTSLGDASNRLPPIWTDALDSTTATIGTIDLGFTEGSIGFADALGNLTEDNAGLFFDPATNRLGIGTNTPASSLDVGDGDISNVGDIALDTISSDAGITVSVILGTDAGDDFIVGNNNALVVEGDSDMVGIGRINPVSKWHSYENNSLTAVAAGLTIEQNGTGDAVAQFLLTGGQRWVSGIDNSDSDSFKIASSADLNTNANLVIETGGQVGIGTTSPDATLEIEGTVTVLQIHKNAGADSSISLAMTGLQLTPNGMSVSNYTPALKFMSADPQFTTENPKFLALITGRATETYDSDTKGGMALDFFTTENTPGATNVPNLAMTIDEDGNVGIGIIAPGGTLEINGTFGLTPSSTQDITAANGITTAMVQGWSNLRVQGSGGAVDITADPQIADGFDGQELCITGRNDTNTVTFDDGTGLDLEGGLSGVVGLRDVMCFEYILADDIWNERIRSFK